MPTINIFTDPELLELEQSVEVHGSTIEECLYSMYEQGVTLKFVAQFSLNGELVVLVEDGGRLSREALNTPVAQDDSIIISPQVNWQIAIQLIVAIVFSVVSALAYSASLGVVEPPRVDASGRLRKSVYSFDGRANGNNNGHPIERQYGGQVIYPSFASATRTYIENNDQYINQLYCLGAGEFTEPTLGEIKIGDTNIFFQQDAEYQWCKPNEAVTLFEATVQTVPSVNNLEMFRADLPDANTDGVHGPWTVSGTDINRIEIDWELPNGFYWQEPATGAKFRLILTMYLEYRATGSNTWATGSYITHTDIEDQNARFTSAFNITNGGNSYEVRVRVANEPTTGATSDGQAGGGVYATDSQFVDRLILNQVKYYAGDAPEASEHCTLLALKLKASSTFNADAINRLNINQRGYTPAVEWKDENDKSQGWNYKKDNTPRIVDIFIDIFRNPLGMGLSDDFIDVAGLLALKDQDQGGVDYNTTFHFVFDQKIDCWTAATKAAAAYRAVPVFRNNKISMHRFDVVTEYKKVFTPYNIHSGTLKFERKMRDVNDYTGISVEYNTGSGNPDSEVTCLLGDNDNTNNLRKVRAEGIVNRSHVYQYGLYLRAKELYQNRFVSFRTGREGRDLYFGDVIGVSHDLNEENPRFSRIKSFIDSRDFILADDVEPSGSELWCHIRKIDGSVLTIRAAYISPIQAGGQIVSVNGNIDIASIMPTDSQAELPFITFTETQEVEPFIITEIRPSGTDEFDITGVIYDPQLYAFDGISAPAEGTTPTIIPIPDAPDVTGLEVIETDLIAGTARLSWDVSLGARSYVVMQAWRPAGEILDYATLGTTSNTFFDVRLQNLNGDGSYSFRVAGVNVAQGAWTDITFTPS